MVVGNQHYRVLLCMFVFTWMIAAVSQTNFLLYLKYALKMEKHFVTFLVTLLLFTLAGLPITLWSMNRFGKRNTYVIGLLVS